MTSRMIDRRKVPNQTGCTLTIRAARTTSSTPRPCRRQARPPGHSRTAGSTCGPAWEDAAPALA